MKNKKSFPLSTQAMQYSVLLFFVGLFVLSVFYATRINHVENTFAASTNLGIGSSAPLSPTPTVILETIPPKVTITSPKDWSFVRRGTIVTIAANASDNVAVKKVDFYINTGLRCSDSIAPYACGWEVPPLVKRNLKITLTAIATDTSGNTASNKITVITR